MTPDQQRIKIAEACGWRIWRYLPTPESGEIMPAMIPPKHLHDQGESMRFADDLPDYLNDLNAMHEAEKVLHLEIGLWGGYCGFLVKDNTWFSAVGATASQRAEAFLKTLNLWEP